MPDKEIITLDGTRVDTLYATVEKGTKEDGTEYEKKQAVAPRTFSSAVTNADGTNLETRIAQILQRINELDGGEYDTLLDEIQDIQTEINNLDLTQWNYHVPDNQSLTFNNKVQLLVSEADSFVIRTLQDSDLTNVLYIDKNNSTYINGNSFFKNIYIPSNTALHFTNNLTQGVSHKIHEYGASGYLEFRTSATGADGDSTINAEINTIGEWHFYNNIQLCRNGTYLYIGNNRARFLNQSDGIYFQTYRNNTWNTDWFINYTVGKVQFPSNIIAPNIASAAAELLSAQQEITAQDLEMIEIQQTLTEQDLDNIETQQTLTEQDLANIEGGLCNE